MSSKRAADPGREPSASPIKGYFKSVFDISDDMMSYEEIDTMMLENTVIHGPNMWILMMATFIASIGLNVNSTAVIIGAMLVSPLMSGIMTMGYSLAVRDLSLLRKAFTRFATQVMISLTTSSLYFFISPLSEASSEMIARISPTIWDVLIATFGGIAGMIGSTRRKKGNVIPGVAIATALMPPLCTAGYGIGTGQLKFFLGGFYLFLINTLFIALATMVITMILGVPYHKSLTVAKQRVINRVIFLIVIIVAAPSVYIGATTVYDSVQSANVKRFISDEFRFSDTQVVMSSYDSKAKEISVSLVGATLTDDVIEAVRSTLPDHGLGDYQLKVTQTLTSKGITEEEFYALFGEAEQSSNERITSYIREEAINDLNRIVEEKDEEIESLREKIDEYEAEKAARTDHKALAQKAQSVFAYLTDIRCGTMTDAQGEITVLVANSEHELSAEQQQTLENWLRAETGASRAEVFVASEELIGQDDIEEIPVTEMSGDEETADTEETSAE
ncbi:MAG: DUF389 domain-containing protein [Oscillospiraceae bacterium]|nr:DUF389 domain-containing protein [Oscillospiraceae bacterium]